MAGSRRKCALSAANSANEESDRGEVGVVVFAIIATHCSDAPLETYAGQGWLRYGEARVRYGEARDPRLARPCLGQI